MTQNTPFISRSGGMGNNMMDEALAEDSKAVFPHLLWFNAGYRLLENGTCTYRNQTNPSLIHLPNIWALISKTC